MRRPLYAASFITRIVDMQRLMQQTGNYVLLPYYHVVSNSPLAHIRHLYLYRDIDTFCRDLDFLQVHYRPISWREIATANANCEPSFCLTFDDGLREVYTTIAPILRERNIPAVFFLNSGCIDNKHLFYRYKVSLLIEEGLRRHRSSQWVQDMLSITYFQQDMIDRVAQELGVDFEAFLQNEQPYMTQRQIQELLDMGFEIGGHSIDHPHYAELSETEQIRQTTECMSVLRQMFHPAHNLFAYPFGQESLSDSALQTLQQGMDCVFGTKNFEPATPPLYNRVWMEGTTFSGEQVVRGEYLRTLIRRHMR